MISIRKTIDVSPEGIDFLIRITDIMEELHHHNFSRTDIIEKLAAFDRADVNLLNEKLRQWRDELKTVPV